MTDVRAAPSIRPAPKTPGAPESLQAPQAPQTSIRRLNALVAKGWRIDPRTGQADLRLRHPQIRHALYMSGDGALVGAEADGATCAIAAEDERDFQAFLGRTPRTNPIRRFVFAHGAAAMLLAFFGTALAIFSIVYDILD